VCPKIKLQNSTRAGPLDQIIYLYPSIFQVLKAQEVPTLDQECSGCGMSGASLRREEISTADGQKPANEAFRKTWPRLSWDYIYPKPKRG